MTTPEENNKQFMRSIQSKHMRERIFKEIEFERMRQDKKWGIRDLPSIFEGMDKPTPVTGQCAVLSNADRVCSLYGLPTEQWAKARCDEDHKQGKDTHARIVTEELVEAISAFADGNPEQGEIELIQLGACIVLWLENIRARKSKVNP